MSVKLYDYNCKTYAKEVFVETLAKYGTKFQAIIFDDHSKFIWNGEAYFKSMLSPNGLIFALCNSFDVSNWWYYLHKEDYQLICILSYRFRGAENFKYRKNTYNKFSKALINGNLVMVFGALSDNVKSIRSLQTHYNDFYGFIDILNACTRKNAHVFMPLFKDADILHSKISTFCGLHDRNLVGLTNEKV